MQNYFSKNSMIRRAKDCEVGIRVLASDLDLTSTEKGYFVENPLLNQHYIYEQIEAKIKELREIFITITTLKAAELEMQDLEDD